jgi:hypothetical protein
MGRPLARPTIENNIIVDNSTQWHGGGVSFCSGVVRNNIIARNAADCGGGGLVFCDGVISNNVVTGNSADYGGGLWLCSGVFENNTMVSNSARSAGGAFHTCSGIITNCIVWGNATPDGTQLYDSSVPVYSCIQNWTGGAEGNISQDPKFVDFDGADDTSLTYADNDYHLAAGSPCVDAGRNESWMWQATDLDGNNRIFYGAQSVTVDIGAYEFGSFPFRILSLARQVDGKLNLTWLSRAGDTYVVWFCTSVFPSQWSNVATVTSQGAVASWTDSASSDRIRFYRIELK